MAKSDANKASTDAALAQIHNCIKRLRDGIQKSASLRAATSPGSSKDRTTDGTDLAGELEACGQKMLAGVVSASMAHDSIIRNVSASREKVGEDQEALLKVRLKLDNLYHEKRALQQQIEACKGSQSKLLGKLNIPLPAVNTESDELAENAHEAITSALNSELTKRKRMSQLVQSMVKETSAKRRRLSESKTELRELPRAIRSLAPSIEPIRRLFSGDDSKSVKRCELPNIKHLPGPLYILCRTALAYRETLGGLQISTVGEPLTDKDRSEAEKAADPYYIHPMRVRIDIEGSDKGPKLRVAFRYHVNLQIVSVTSAIVVDGEETPSYPTKELQMLYPMDLGEVSPNPSNDFFSNGSFEYDVAKAKEGRPYVWANIICGIPCVPRISPVQGLPGGAFLDWPDVAAQQLDHLRFKDVVETLQERLRTIVSLKRQIEDLMLRKFPIRTEQQRKSGEVETKLQDFAKLSRQDVPDEEKLSRRGTDGRYTEVWGMVLSRGELKINCMIGLEPDYPVGPPVFRLKCTSSIPNLTEKDVIELERTVNEYHPTEESGDKRDMLLGAQIRALCRFIDNLVAVCESIDEGTVESGSGEIQGRTRSKKDAILGRFSS